MNARPDLAELQAMLADAEAVYRQGDRQRALELIEGVEKAIREFATPESVRDAAAALRRRILRSKHERRSRWALILVAAVALSAVALLAWIRVPSTEVEMELRVEQLTFELEKDWPIYSLAVEQIGISGLDDLEIDPVLVREVRELDQTSGGTTPGRPLDVGDAVRIERTADVWNVNIEAPSPQIVGLFIPEGATVTLSKSAGGDRQYRMRISGSSVSGTVSPPDTFVLSCSNCRSGTGRPGVVTHLQFVSAGGEVEFHDLNGALDVVFVLSPEVEEASVFASGVFVEDIDFTRLAGDVRESTVVGSGTIYFSELDGEKLALRDRDFLLAGGLKDFQLRRMSLDNDVVLSMHGRVAGLKTGTRSFMYERRPSYLEWFSTNRSLGLFLGTLLTVLSGVLAVLYRLNFLREV